MSDVFARLLVIVDGSEAAIHSAKIAIDLAKEHSSSFLAVHVVDQSKIKRIARALNEPEPKVEDDLKRKGLRYLDHVVQLAQSHGVNAERILLLGHPPSEIAATALSKDVTLIVIGEPRKRELLSRLHPQPTHSVLDRAPCPVLVVKH